MSLMGPVVSLYVLCWLLAVSSGSVRKILPLPSPENFTKTTPVCNECNNGRPSQNTLEIDQSSPLLTTTGLNLNSANRNAAGTLNESVTDDKQTLTSIINDSNTTHKPLIQPPTPAAKTNNSTKGPAVTDAPLSHSSNNTLNQTAGVPSNTTAAPANTREITTSINTTTLLTSTLKTTLAPPTTTALPTTKIAPTHAPTTIAPSIVTEKHKSTSPQTTELIPTEPPAATTTTTTTTTTTITTTSAASTHLDSNNSSPTVQYLSPVVEVAGRGLTSQLVDTASLLAILLFGLLFFFVVVAVFMTQAYESYRRKDYTQVDYLINGMYTDTGV